MKQIVLNLELPESTINAIDIPNERLPDFIRKTMAVELYREGILSLGKAKELAGFENKWQMIELLNSKGVPIHFSAEEAQSDFNTLNHLLS